MSEQRRPRKSDVIIGSSRCIRDLYDRISMVAPTEVTVAISGESGTGKELVARTVHANSPRRDSPFVVVNCAAIPENLLESELFGHVRGAFTDASKDREGLLTAADGGTLFLDEIGEMSLSLQSKLLRVLECQEFRRVGADKDTKVDFRLVTATNMDLEQAVAHGRFRADFFYRIHVFPIYMLPLRQRLEDIPLLAQHFLLLHRDKSGKKIAGFTPGALEALAQYSYPGNVRELENKIHHALVLCKGERIDVAALPRLGTETAAPSEIDLTRKFRDLKREIVERFENEYALRILEANGGNLAAAARQGGIDRKNLWAMAKKYDIAVNAIRSRTRDEGS